MLDGIKEINSYLNKWLKDHNFDVTVAYANDFSFDNYNDILYYTFTVSERHEKLFLQVCQECRPEIVNIDNFLLSFFHELGHYMTLDNFSQTEWNKYMKLVNKLNNSDKISDKKLLKYYHNKVEFAATQWGCGYIMEHQSECINFLNKVSKLIMKFYRLNNIEV